jgi:hypothetical protein
MEPASSIPTLRVREPRELLALVPHRLGFRPTQSAVAVSLRSARGRVGLVIRTDLDDLARARSGPHVARLLVGRLGVDDASHTVLVVYTAQDPRGLLDSTVHAAAANFRAAAEPALGDVPVWVVTPTGYFSLDCVDDCCPPGGRPLHELESTQVSAHLVLAGSAVAESRDDLVRFPRVPADRRREVARVRRRREKRLEEALGQDPAAVEQWRRDGLTAWRDVVATLSLPTGGPAVASALWGRLEAALADRRTRDAILVALVPGTRDLPERSLAGERPPEAEDRAVGRALGLVVDPVTGVVPPPGPTALHERALEQVVAHGRARAQAPALTLLALLAWWRGEGARASLLLAQALDHEPGHRLAVLLERAVGAGVPPGWVRCMAELDRGADVD